MVKGVATSIITVAVLMGSVVACGGTTQVVAPASEPETTVEETPEEEVAEPLSTADQFELVKGGVVRLEVATCEAGGIGTGFLIDENHVVTVAHVVDEAQEIIAYVDDEIAIAEVVAIDLDRDLALLRTDIPVGSYYFSLGDFEYRTGDQISVIGFPLGLDLSLTVGTISNEEVSFDFLPLLTFMQIDAPANPGNSGGPVLNADGEVIGIVDWQISDTQGLNFAISVDSVDRIFSSWVDNTPISFPACGAGSSTTEAAPSTGSSTGSSNNQTSIDIETILTDTYRWGSATANKTKVLQEALGLTPDGSYGSGTRSAHIAALEERGLSTSNVPEAPAVVPTPTPIPEPTPTPEPELLPPSNVTASVSGNSIVVSWTPPPTVGSGNSVPRSRNTHVHLAYQIQGGQGVNPCGDWPSEEITFSLPNYNLTNAHTDVANGSSHTFPIPETAYMGSPYPTDAIQGNQVTLKAVVRKWYEVPGATICKASASASFTITVETGSD